MKTYIVWRREVWVQPVFVDADSPEEAIDRVRAGWGEEEAEGLEYSHTMDPEHWTAEEDK